MTEREPPVGGGVQADLFRLLVESVRDYAIFLLDPTGHILSWNEGARRIKGYTADEIIGKHFSIFYPARDVRHGKPDFGLRVAVDEGRWEDEGWRVRKGGSQFWASVVLTALYDGGALVGFAKVTRDLTERKRAEEERARLLALEHAARTETEAAADRLRAVQSVTEAALSHLNLQELLAALLDRIVDVLAVDTAAVLLLDQEGGDVLVARAAKGLDEEVEQGVRIPVGKGFAGQIAAQRRPVVLEDVRQDEVLDPLLLRKGIRSMLGAPLMVEGRVLGVLHVGSRHRRQFIESDIQLLEIVADRAALAIDHARLFEAARTARYQAEAAEATVKARDQFLQVAAHELKTPLTSLRLAAQTLLRQVDRGQSPDVPSLRRSLRTVDRQIDRLSRLVTQLLETVRLQAGRLEVDRTQADLVALVQGVADQVQAHTNRHSILLRAPEQVWARVDPLRIEQVVLNLLDNAVKYSPDGGQIVIELEARMSGAVRLAIRDRGLGVAPAHRDHIFEQFYRAHGRDYRSGMGLGLYISRRIVEMHGGTIAAEFPTDGGARFVVELPPDLQTDGKEQSA